MNTATEALVIINSVVLLVFLVIGIVFLIRMNILLNSLNKITEKLEEVADSAGKIGVMLENITSGCLLYTSPSPRDGLLSRMPSSA